MANRFAVILLCVFLSGCGTLSTNEVAWHTLNVADIAITMNRCDNLSEANPLLGKDPTDEQLVLFGLGFSLLYHGAHQWLEENEPGGVKFFEWATLLVKGLVVANNINNHNRYC